MAKLKAFTMVIHTPRNAPLQQPRHIVQCQAVVITTSAKKAAALLDVSVGELATYGGPGLTIDRASEMFDGLAADTLWVKPLNRNDADWVKVDR